jgi:hypothetical protein
LIEHEVWEIIWDVCSVINQDRLFIIIYQTEIYSYVQTTSLFNKNSKNICYNMFVYVGIYS